MKALSAAEIRYLNALKRRKKALEAQADLIAFARMMKPDPDHPEDPDFSLYEPARHHRVIGAALQEVEKGNIKRLIINCPPRHGKSELASRLFPAWFIGKHPRDAIISACYNEKFSWDFGREVKDYLEDPIYRQIFPELQIATASVDRIETELGAKVFFTGRGGSITGRGAIGLVLDDPIKDRVEADSPTTREKVWKWYVQVIRSRLVTAKGWIIIIQCMTGDTEVTMLDGSLRRLDEIRPDERVLSWDGRRFVGGRVAAVVDNGPTQTYEITTSRTKVRANARHPFLVLADDGAARWVRTKDLRAGMRIVRLDTGSIGESSAFPSGASAPRNAEECAPAITPKQSGGQGVDRRLQPPKADTDTAESGDMGSTKKSSSECFETRAASARSVRPMAASDGLAIGSQISSRITTTRPENFEGFCVTTATEWPDEIEIPAFWSAPSNTSEVDTDEILSISLYGVERVFDLSIEDTHCFVANGLWTHNTRWHEDDLVGRLTDKTNPNYIETEARKWRIIDLPALARDNDPIGRKEGEPLWPARFPREYLEDMREGDPRGFQALYQGSPTPEKGNFFPGDRLLTYTKEELPPKDELRFYAASDHAVSTAQERDKTCLGIVGVDKDQNIWVMPELVWGRYSTDIVVERMIDLMAKFRPLFWWAERGHISKSIGPFLRKRMLERGTFCSVAEVTPVHDKKTRAQAINGRIAMRMVYFPSFAPWWAEARDELLKFPYGTHDDFVDFIAWIGMGLGAQTSKRAIKPKAAPRPGTLGWIKAGSRSKPATLGGGW